MQKSEIRNPKPDLVFSFLIRIFYFLFFIFYFSLSGCGARTESSRYYYSPSWTRDGKIIFIGATQNVEKDLLGSQLSSSYFEYVKTVYATGTGESSTLFDATGAPPYSMSCSPARDYVAFMDELRSDLFGKIKIQNISAGSYTGMKELELNFENKIRCFDWSNNGNQIVYCTTNEVRVRDWDDFVGTTDTLVTAESDLEFVSWKYGDRIAFVRSSGGNKLLSLIKADGSLRLDLSAASSVDKPQISSSNTNEVYGIAGQSYVKVEVNTGTTSEVASSFTGVLPRLSPNADRVTYGKSGETSGIYVLDVAAGTETKIK